MMRLAILVLSVAVTVMVARAAGSLSPVVDPYLRVQTSLANDYVEGIGELAEQIAAAADALGAEAKPLAEAARRLESAKKIEEVRTAFGKLSDALLEYSQKTGTPLGEGVRVAYCPMAPGSWAQKGDTIANPYYGASMLTCGSFKK
jgi:Cu(I)/Ag(I) efflux system membrane fusion protein